PKILLHDEATSALDTQSEGTHNELRNKKGFYSKLIEIQQIQLSLKVEKNLNVMNSLLKVDFTKPFTIKDEDCYIFPFFAIIYGNIIQALSETGDTLRHYATFCTLMFLIIAVMTFFVNMIQNVTLGFSTLTSHLSLDVTHINGLAGFSLGNVLQVATTIFVSVIVALIVSWKLTLIYLCTVPLLVACEDVDNIRMVAALTREDDL
ncbi:27031_t:CDS:2, partial [Gigaspora margarita]